MNTNMTAKTGALLRQASQRPASTRGRRCRAHETLYTEWQDMGKGISVSKRLDERSYQVETEDATWEKASVSKRLDECSYQVETEDATYRRNRVDL